jgi:hypothetical protein
MLLVACLLYFYAGLHLWLDVPLRMLVAPQAVFCIWGYATMAAIQLVRTSNAAERRRRLLVALTGAVSSELFLIAATHYAFELGFIREASEAPLFLGGFLLVLCGVFVFLSLGRIDGRRSA